VKISFTWLCDAGLVVIKYFLISVTLIGSSFKFIDGYNWLFDKNMVGNGYGENFKMRQ
jgi:hypothetical protein